MRKIFATAALGLCLAGCAGVNAAFQAASTVITGVAELDAQFRDKCNYARDGQRIAAEVSAVAPDSGASVVAQSLANAVSAYCSGQTFAGVAQAKDAMQRMQRLIEAVRPLAALIRR